MNSSNSFCNSNVYVGDVWWYPWNTYPNTSPYTLPYTNIPMNNTHEHDFVYSEKDAYGYIATCRTCGEVKVTPIKLGATWTITTSQ